jgi:hypothetical protein
LGGLKARKTIGLAFARAAMMVASDPLGFFIFEIR